MSVEYCMKHDRRYDTDYHVTCVRCDLEELEMHPKAAEHQALREAAAEADRIKRANLELWTTNLKLRFVHIRDEDIMGEVLTKGGLTVAFSLPKPSHKRLIPVAISYVHPNDTFCKREGRYYAAMEFYIGHTIDIRIPRSWTISPAVFLKSFFEGVL